MACTTTLTSISTSCGANLASIKKLWIGGFESATFTYDVETGVGPDGTDVIEDVKTAALKANEAAWVEFAFKKNTGEMTSEMTRNDNGSYYFTNSANLVFAKQDAAKRLSASTLSATTGVAVGDANQYTVTLSADEAYMPIPLLSTAAETIITALTPAQS